MSVSDTFDRDVGRRVRDARTTKGLTQENVAQAIGLTRPSVANIESGKQGRLSAFLLYRIAQVLGVSVANLVGAPMENKSAETSASEWVERILKSTE